ncbi:phage head spike fiber domain-containing protein, partial [Limosilactobacillus reuteri]|uniref:phage head spike fiber domain-containing protein n=1 Tax=Limosilactobacillus reuteri TaxID=1598 RepID=UPI003F7E8E3D
MTNKTNILLGTRRFTTNNWQQREHVEICSDPWKGFLVARQNSPIEGIQQAYDVKAGTTYTFSLFAKMDTLDDSNKPQIVLAKNNLDTSLDTKIDVWRKEIEDITSDFKRYDLTFTPSEDCTIYPHVISNSNNPIFVCGYQLEIGKTSTPWEPNQEDVGDYVEKSEAQFNVYNDKIQALTEKQRQQGDTQEKLRTEVTQTAEGVKQVSESLKDTNGDITKLRGDLERTADHMKSEYETYTNKAVGQISDSTLNLIRNSSFQNKDEDFAQWQNVSAKANVRQDKNGLRWVELTQSGLTANNPEGITSNYFNIKQGKVTVAVDIKSGDKASLDNDSVLSLELYNDAKKRVDFYDVSLSQLGLSKELFGDHMAHRGLYRLGIDRNDAKYMTVKAKLVKNGDLYFTNFSARLSSIDDGAYEPNPDDINQQILKQNTKIEQNAKEVAIKANSVDVTRDIKSAVDGIQVGGRNLLLDTDLMSAQYWTANSSKAIYRNRHVPGINNALLDTSISSWASFNYKQKVIFDTSKEYTFSAYVCSLQKGQSVTLWLNPDDTYKGSFQNATLTNSTDDYDWQRFSVTFKPKKSEAYLSISTSDIKTGQGVWLSSLMLEEGNRATSYTKAPEDTSAEIKSAKDAAIKVASDQINIHVNEISTQFDDKLNKRVNEVKTASEKFTSDGIEQVVTKVTNVKNDVDR